MAQASNPRVRWRQYLAQHAAELERLSGLAWPRHGQGARIDPAFALALGLLRAGWLKHFVLAGRQVGLPERSLASNARRLDHFLGRVRSTSQRDRDTWGRALGHLAIVLGQSERPAQRTLADRPLDGSDRPAEPEEVINCLWARDKHSSVASLGVDFGRETVEPIPVNWHLLVESLTSSGRFELRSRLRDYRTNRLLVPGVEPQELQETLRELEREVQLNQPASQNLETASQRAKPFLAWASTVAETAGAFVLLALVAPDRTGRLCELVHRKDVVSVRHGGGFIPKEGIGLAVGQGRHLAQQLGSLLSNETKDRAPKTIVVFFTSWPANGPSPEVAAQVQRLRSAGREVLCYLAGRGLEGGLLPVDVSSP
jgi:hypothetical protein